jgi:hypothetical protein
MFNRSIRRFVVIIVVEVVGLVFHSCGLQTGVLYCSPSSDPRWTVASLMFACTVPTLRFLPT